MQKNYIKSCAFTGYRLQKMPFGFDEADSRCIDFKHRLYDTLETLIGKGYIHFLSGGALGMDMFAAEAILHLKRKYPWITLEIVRPYDTQSSKWDPKYQKRYEHILAAADTVTETGHAFTKSCLFRRNRYLVDHCDLLLAAYDGLPGGTAMTVDYAKQSHVQVQLIAPEEQAS